MKFRKKILWVGIGIVFLGLGLGIGESTSSLDKRQEMYKELQLFTQTLSLIQSQYVDIDKVELKELIYGAIKGLLESLNDPHTRFMTPEAYKEMKVETEGEFGGLGIVIGLKENQLTVISPIEDTPAALAGIKAGDKIMEIDGVTTKDITLFNAVNKLRGPKGTKVTLSIERKGEEKWLTFTITRDIIRIKSVKYDIIKKDIGYIRLTTFNQNTPEELREALSKLEEKKIKSLILDLRNNPGGLLESAVAVADEFLPANVLIVSIQGRLPQMNRDYKSTKAGVDYPLVVLINNGSASGAEIVAGAIQDPQYEKFLITDKKVYDKWVEEKKKGGEISITQHNERSWYVKRKVRKPRGVIVGTPSFGKGSVQTVIPLADNSGIALTTAKYYTPAGNSIHDNGIIPNVTVEETTLSKEEEEILKKLEEKEYIKEFVKKHNPYKKRDIEELLKKLEKDKMKIKESILRRKIEMEIRKMSLEKKPIYDLVRDIQLQQAVEILLASQIFSKE